MILTVNLNQAALLVAIGAKLIRIETKGTEWQFVLSVKSWQVWYEKYVGWVPYRKFCAVRVSLKRKKYDQDGKYGTFRGEKDGFWFEDVVRIVPWTKTDRKRMEK